MIIERKYVPFIYLLSRDAKSKKVFMNAFNNSYLPEFREEAWKMLAYQSLSEMQLGWCFKNIKILIDDFAKLDKEDPFDNGLSLVDVNCVEITDKSYNEITLELRSKTSEHNQIVKIIKIVE